MSSTDGKVVTASTDGSPAIDLRRVEFYLPPSTESPDALGPGNRVVAEDG